MTKFKMKLNPTRGVNLVRRNLVESIYFLTGITLNSEAQRYFHTVDLWCKTRGVEDTIRRLKVVHALAVNYMLDQPRTEVVDISLSIRKGFPKDFEYLKKYKQSPEGIQAVLSLTNYYRSFKSTAAPNMDSIITPSKGYDSTLESKVCGQIRKTWKFSCSEIPKPEHQYSTKNGPNGKRTISALLDWHALPEHLRESISYLNMRFGRDNEEGQKSWWVNIGSLFGGKSTNKEQSECTTLLDFPTFDVELVNTWRKKTIHSRLAVKREGGGKNRIFAMVDYYTQCVLSPLHDRLNEILRTIPQDCTFDQTKGAEKIKEWTSDDKSDTYSFDLSSATDRFPVTLQCKVLENLVGDPEVAYRWRELMTNREFHYKGKTYKWAVGQPLGARSSWPMFALTHHLLVRYCCKVTRSSLANYYLLGDDIILKGHKLAKKYRSVMSRLGVDINLTKSVIGSSAEFAKRLFKRGYEVSPVPMQLIQSFVKDPTLAKAVLDELQERSCNKFAADLRKVYFCQNASLAKETLRQKVTIIATSPIPYKGDWEMVQSECPASSFSWGDSPWARVNDTFINVGRALYSHQYSEYEKQLMSFLETLAHEEVENRERGVPGLPPGVEIDSSPWGRALIIMNAQADRVGQGLMDIMSSKMTSLSTTTKDLNRKLPSSQILSFQDKPFTTKYMRFEKLTVYKSFLSLRKSTT